MADAGGPTKAIPRLGRPRRVDVFGQKAIAGMDTLSCACSAAAISLLITR